MSLQSIRERPGYHWFIVATVCVGALMAALDASIINIALPVLKKHFQVRMHVIEWVSLVYLLTLAGLIVPFGRLADMLGRRWMYTLGFSVFIVGSWLCGFASTLVWLLASRCVQAVGAAMLQANSVAIITAATPDRDRGKAIGIQASAQGIGLSLGPALGGALLSALDWRWIFYVNVPVGIVGTVLGILFLPKDQPVVRKERFDWLGAGLLAPAMVALLFILNTGLKAGWTSPTVIGSYVVLVLGLVGFIRVEQRSPAPLVDLKLFRGMTFSLGTVTGVLSFTLMYDILFLVPFYLDNVLRFTTFTAGLYLTIIPIGMTVCTPLSGALADGRGVKLPMALGMLASSLGCLALIFLQPGTWGYLLPLGLFLVGAGLGLFTPPNNSSVMGSVRKTRLGVAGGILNMSRTLGMSLGVAIGGLCYQGFLSLMTTFEEGAAISHQVVAFRLSFMVLLILGLLTLGLSYGRKRNDVNKPNIGKEKIS